jgi:CRP-like cAMP-binding protein
MIESKVHLNSNQLSLDKDTIEHIANGSIVINSIELMLDILNKFPSEPDLVRIYADMLLKDKMHAAAAKAYNRATSLYLKNGKMLPAIVAKISQWHIEMLSDQNVKSFFSELSNNNNKELPIGRFFSKLSIDELKALCFLFETIRLPAGEVVKEIGDTEDHLFFIVSGQLKDSIYLTLQNQRKVFRKPTLILSENDYFGDIYPFNKEQRSQSYIETLKPVELVRIPKEKLMRICRKYPNIELGIIDLLKIRSQSIEGEPSFKLRRAPRYELKLKLNVDIFPKNSVKKTITLEGFSKDISIGGMAIILDLNNIKDLVDISSLRSSLNEAKICIGIPAEMLSWMVSGRIVWSRKIVHEGAKTVAIGMQFSKMSPRVQGLLFSFINSIE